MPFLKIYPDFIVEHPKDASGRGKPTTDVLKMQNFKRRLLLTCGVKII